MSKKFILAIQGEGRGHLTQAISMYELLIEKGHTVSAIIIGSSGKRKIPEFLNQKINSS
jgi:UDP:flavonoid glycosyltransferase YjiC (YdhE family)